MILDKIVAATEIRIAKEKQEQSFEAVKAEALALPAVQDFPFEKALREQDFNFICEVKKASPSKGIIAGMGKEMLAYFRPNFHPNDLDTHSLLETWKQKLGL